MNEWRASEQMIPRSLLRFFKFGSHSAFQSHKKEIIFAECLFACRDSVLATRRYPKERNHLWRGNSHLRVPSQRHSQATDYLV